jgi:hypothetical protein
MIIHCGLPFSCIMFKHFGFLVMQLSMEVLPNFSFLSSSFIIHNHLGGSVLVTSIVFGSMGCYSWYQRDRL